METKFGEEKPHNCVGEGPKGKGRLQEPIQTVKPPGRCPGGLACDQVMMSLFRGMMQT